MYGSFSYAIWNGILTKLCVRQIRMVFMPNSLYFLKIWKLQSDSIKYTTVFYESTMNGSCILSIYHSQSYCIPQFWYDISCVRQIRMVCILPPKVTLYFILTLNYINFCLAAFLNSPLHYFHSAYKFKNSANFQHVISILLLRNWDQFIYCDWIEFIGFTI